MNGLKSIKTLIAASVLVLSTSGTALAGDEVHWGYDPREPDGLQYWLNNATVLQGFLTGQCNNWVLHLEQLGKDNSSHLMQDGIDNYSYVIQDGEFNNAQTLQYGSGNYITIDQLNSGNFAAIYQYGDGHGFSVSQPGDGYIEITQE